MQRHDPHVSNDQGPPISMYQLVTITQPQPHHLPRDAVTERGLDNSPRSIRHAAFYAVRAVTNASL